MGVINYMKGVFAEGLIHVFGHPGQFIVGVDPTGVYRGVSVDASGHLIPGPIPGSTPVTVTLTTNTDTQIIAAPGAGSIYVINVSAGNTSATLTRLDLREGPAGTIRYSMVLAASGGGFVKTFWPRPWMLPATTAFTGILSIAVTDVRINVDYYVL